MNHEREASGWTVYPLQWMLLHEKLGCGVSHGFGSVLIGMMIDV
jgi:hypothetical protein